MWSVANIGSADVKKLSSETGAAVKSPGPVVSLDTSSLFMSKSCLQLHSRPLGYLLAFTITLTGVDACR